MGSAGAKLVSDRFNLEDVVTLTESMYLATIASGILDNKICVVTMPLEPSGIVPSEPDCHTAHDTGGHYPRHGR